MSNFEPIPSKYRHRLSGYIFVVTNTRSGYDVEFRKGRASLGTLRGLRPPQGRTASNARVSDERLVIDAAISFATCCPFYEFGDGTRGSRNPPTSEEDALTSDWTIDEWEWYRLHLALGGEGADIPGDRYNHCGEAVYHLSQVY